ncbi:MAG: cytochrome P460 family protein [Planctomycetota bacterium]
MYKLIAIGLIGALGVVWSQDSKPARKPFGSRRDVAFARDLWKAMKGYEHWKLTTPVYKGGSPHGKWVRLYSTFVGVGGKSYPIIVKDNFGGRGVTTERIQKDRKAFLKAVTVMLRREPGYDRENQDWFYAKYAPDGTVEKNPKGMLLAGRVAKGMNKGCISCHLQAQGNDFLFSNDE